MQPLESQSAPEGGSAHCNPPLRLTRALAFTLRFSFASLPLCARGNFRSPTSRPWIASVCVPLIRLATKFVKMNFFPERSPTKHDNFPRIRRINQCRLFRRPGPPAPINFESRKTLSFDNASCTVKALEISREQCAGRANDSKGRNSMRFFGRFFRAHRSF